MNKERRTYLRNVTVTATVTATAEQRRPEMERHARGSPAARQRNAKRGAVLRRSGLHRYGIVGNSRAAAIAKYEQVVSAV